MNQEMMVLVDDFLLLWLVLKVGWLGYRKSFWLIKTCATYLRMCFAPEKLEEWQLDNQVSPGKKIVRMELCIVYISPDFFRRAVSDFETFAVLGVLVCIRAA